MVTGTFDQYDKLSKVHFDVVNNQRAEFNKNVSSKIKEYAPQELTTMLRKMFDVDFFDSAEKKYVF